MAYTKPGIEIKQEQRSATPILTAPDLESCIVGEGFHWQDPTWDDPNNDTLNSIYSVPYDGSELVIASSGINDIHTDIVTDTTVVDLMVTAGDDAGTLKHLIPGTDFTVTGNDITITAGIPGITSAQVRVGYLAKNATTEGKFIKITSVSEISELIGEPVSWNPLAFGALLAIENSGSSTNVYGLGDATAMADARDALEIKDFYAIAALESTPDVTAWKTHVEAMSEPTSKRERVAFLNEEYTYTGTNSTDAAGIRDRNSAYGSKRIVTIHPYSGYVLETRHISTIKPTYIAATFSGTEAAGMTAMFARDVTVNNKKYKAFAPITEAIWQELVDGGFGDSNGLVTVYAPVPGYYYAAEVAGQVAGKAPEQPLTNLPTSGVRITNKSQDLFSETDLDTMGSGGTYIMTQVNEQSPIVSRHQVSTDITSVAKREVSITNALDFTAKFLRNSLNPYIGRFNITPAFLKLVNSVLVSSSLYLTRTGVVNDIRSVSVNQDENNPDTINVTLEVKVKYPVNYIKITLVF